MPTDADRSLSNLRKRRGVIKRSITRLVNTLKTLEANSDDPDVGDRARPLIAKLEGWDKDFVSIHLEIVDLLEEESEDLEKEHEVLDKHEDDIADITLRLQKLVKPSSSPANVGCEKVPSHKLARVQRCLEATLGVLASVKEDHDDVPLLQQHQEQLSDSKRELSSIYEELILLDLPDEHGVVIQHAKLEDLLFDCSHGPRSSKVPATSDRSSKLPKLDVPTFDGEILHWQQFWEQFEVSVDSRTSLTNAEKLVYLQQSVKHGSARTAIEGLSRSGNQYQEAIDCLKARYNRPRHIHRAHVCAIMDSPSLKDGSGKELRRIHDTLQQHVCALKTMKSEPDPSFITSMIELKLDTTTMFEWQKHSQEKVKEVPHYQDILDFLNLRAQASKTLARPAKKQVSTPGKKPTPFGKVASFAAASTDFSRYHCIICTSERHPLYVCPKFKAMSPDNRLSTCKSNNICLNCFGSNHTVRQCKSHHRCKKCQQLHHTLLHVDSPSDNHSSHSSDTPSKVVSNAAVKLKHSSLLMTCRVLVFAADGSPVEARALLDNASTSSFVSERLVQSLRLTRSHHNVSVSGIAGSLTNSPIQSVANFQISSALSNQRKIDLTAIVLPKVTCDLPVSPVPFDLSWTHLSDIPLAYPAFGEPRRIDILLGVDVFVDILRHGRQTGPSGSPVAIETEFGWVICGGSTGEVSPSGETNLHVTALQASATCSDDILRKFWEIEESPVSSPVFSLEERSVMQHFEANYSRTKAGRFVVPLPRKPDARPIGESRSQAVRRFRSLERSLNHKGRFQEVNAIMQEYLSLGHAVVVPMEDVDKDPASVFYLPMHLSTRVPVLPPKSELCLMLPRDLLQVCL